MTSPSQLWRNNNRQKYLDWSRKWNKEYYYRNRHEIYKLLGDKCCKCGIKDYEVLRTELVKDTSRKC